MKKTLPTATNVTSLSKHQQNALDYWNGAINELERTSTSVLDLFRRNNDSENYAKYSNQYDDFVNMRKSLAKDVRNAIQSNNLERMEKIISDAIRTLKDKVYLRGSPSEKSQLRSSMSEEYDEALMAITQCMAHLRKKLQIVDKCLGRLSEEMTLYNALGKELRSLMKATIQAKKDKREQVASTVIALAPQVMSYIERIKFEDVVKKDFRCVLKELKKEELTINRNEIEAAFLGNLAEADEIAARIVKLILNADTNTKIHILKLIESEPKDVIPLTPNESLALIIDANLTRSRYEHLQHQQQHLSTLCESVGRKKKCYSDGIEISDCVVKIPLQSLLDKTAERLFESIDEENVKNFQQIDGKSACYLTETFFSNCTVCNALPSEMNNPQKLGSGSPNADNYQFVTNYMKLESW
ncbi:hypothetical protein Bhyg_00835 [Pseudolycoriella hygida]|uniref:Uncharacterized protein n=1 Tax=Pseudolycoriella hygida TaxID=35572 RepID=A0A9Q0N8S0_9DIPT|nr:hypothetical protein Bhyg_00835 [Pseudolycoriella hygida]